MSICNSIAERLRGLRDGLGLTLDQLAERTGYARSTISSVENGLYPASERYLSKMAEVFHVEIEWLRSGRGDMKPAVVDNSHAEMVWAPHISNYPLQLRDLAQKFRDYSAEMVREADELQKQAERFEYFLDQRRAPLQPTEPPSGAASTDPQQPGSDVAAPLQPGSTPAEGSPDGTPPD